MIRYTYYEPLKDIFESNGYFALLNLEYENKEKSNFVHGSELGEYIGSPQKNHLNKRSINLQGILKRR